MSSSFEVKSQKILGSPDPKDGVWSIPFEHEPDEVDKLKTRGRLYLVVEFDASDNVDLQLASKIIIDEIKEKYYGDLDGTPLQALEDALISGKEKLQEIAQSQEQKIDKFNFNIAAGVVWGKVLYIAQIGTTCALIIRNGEIVDIGHKTSGEVMTTSGLLESDDVIVLSTKSFEEKYKGDKLLESLGDLDEQLRGSSDSPSLSSVVIRFKKSLVPSKNEIFGFVSKMGSEKESKQTPSLQKETPSKSSDDKVQNSKKDTAGSEQEKAISTIGSFEEDSASESVSKGGSEDENNNEHVKKDTRGRKKKKLILGSIILLFFVGIGALLYTGNYLGSLKGMFGKSGGGAQKEVNVVDIESYESRYQRLVDSNASIEEFRQLKSDLERELSADVSNSEVKSLLGKTESKISELSGTELPENTEVVFDLSNRVENPTINKIKITPDGLLVSDTGSKQVFLVDGGKVINEIAASDEFLAATYADNSYYLINKNSIMVGSAFDELEEYSLDVSVEEVLDVEVYSDNVYILQGNRIQKYFNQGNTFESETWGELDKTYNSIAIDGSIYVADGEITEYYLGEDQNFSIQNLPDELSSPIFIQTSRGESSLYILDKDYYYEVNKEAAEFSSRTSIGDLRSVPNSFLFDNGELYIAADSKVFKVGLE